METSVSFAEIVLAAPPGIRRTVAAAARSALSAQAEPISASQVREAVAALSTA